jgi:hypothetical protein
VPLVAALRARDAQWELDVVQDAQRGPDVVQDVQRELDVALDVTLQARDVVPPPVAPALAAWATSPTGMAPMALGSKAAAQDPVGAGQLLAVLASSASPQAAAVRGALEASVWSRLVGSLTTVELSESTWVLV